MGKAKLKASERRQLSMMLQEARETRLYRRLLAVLEYDRGVPISAVAKSLGVSCQSVHNWIARCRERSNAAELRDAPHPGRPARAGELFDTVLCTLLMLSLESFGYHATHRQAVKISGFRQHMLGDEQFQHIGRETRSNWGQPFVHLVGVAHAETVCGSQQLVRQPCDDVVVVDVTKAVKSAQHKVVTVPKIPAMP